jgi:hypothetical protein
VLKPQESCEEELVMDFSSLFPLIHLVPTVAVLGAAFFVLRAISVRVTWRRSHIRDLDDTLA